MIGEWSSRVKSSAELSLFLVEFELVQRPMKCLPTLGTCHYNNQKKIVQGLNLESVE